MWASKAPALITALVARFAAWPDLADVDVRDGPQIVDADIGATEVLLVGWTRVEGEIDVESTISLNGMGDPDREVTNIRCELAVLIGTTDVSAARLRAYELLAFAGSAIASDRTLGHLALRTQIASVLLNQTQTDMGMQAVITFTVEVDAFTAR